MLSQMRSITQGFFGKLLFFFLIGMFVLWGIGDMLRNVGGGGNTAATVGKTQISIQELRAAVQRTHANPAQVLDSLVNKTLLENEENALGIAVNDDAVADAIRAMPEFRGKDGHFDKTVYVNLLKQSGTSEARLIEDIRQDIASNLLMGALTAGVQVPENTVLALYRLRNEQRGASLLLLPPGAVSAKVAAPTEQEVKAYYDAHAKEFTLPEARSLSYVTLPVAEVQGKITVPDADIKRVYDERKGDFQFPERRVVEDLQFDNEQDAKAASAQLAQGKPVAGVIQSSPVTNKDKAALGAVAREEVMPEAADQVFALKENTATPALFANVRWHVFHVSKIEPAREQTLDEARPAITAGLASQEAQETLTRLVNGLEDGLAGGATLEQAAEKAGQKAHTVGPLTHDGVLADGKKADLPAYDNFLAIAFATPEKDHSQATQAADGSYFIVRVDAVSPEHVQPLAEVKDKAAKGASDEKIHAQLGKVAQDISTQLRAGKKLGDVLAAAGVSAIPASSGGIRRSTETVPEGALEGKPLPHGLINELFRIAPHDTTHAYPTAAGNYMIATLTQVTPAPQKADPESLQGIRDELKNTLTDEALQQYLSTLQAKYPVSRNRAALGKSSEESGE